ncbi:MAG: PAS domain S-box protein, partial [Gammaproteobacteria bacterium]
MLTSSILMGIVITQSGTSLLMEASAERLSQESKVVATRLQDIFDAIQRDLEFLARSPSLRRLISTLQTTAGDPASNTVREQAKRQLQEVFAALLVNHPWYIQARLIGAADDGMELVRIDQVDNQIRRAPKHELQHKGQRAYFRETFDNAAGEFYWSAINLNREHGQIEEPHQPVLRVALPVTDADETPFGIVIINMDARRVFEATRSVVSPGLTFYIANRQGDYLYHPDPGKTFGFELGQRYRIQDDFPEVTLLLDGGRSDVIAEEVALPGSEPVVAHLSMLPVPQGASDELLLGLTMPRSVIVEEVNAARRESAVLILPFLLVGTIVVIWLVRVFIAPLERVTREVSRFAPGTSRPRLPEEDRHDEVGQLAQAFSLMAGRIERQVGQLKEQRKRFQSLFETAPDAIILIDEDGTVEFMNGSAERLFGYDASEVLGHDIKMLMPEPDSK